MIEINLLPPEMRKVDRTSLKRLLCMVTAVVLVSGSVMGAGISYRRHRTLSEEKVTLTGEVARLEPAAKEYDVLMSEIQEIQTRIATIAEIRSTRLRWGSKLDQLYAILPEYVWFEEIGLKRARGRGTVLQPVSTLSMECYVAGADEKRYSEFCRVLTGELVGEGPFTGETFFSEFDKLLYSGWERDDFPETEEGIALKFKLELPVTSPAAPVPPKRQVRPVVAAKK